MPMKLLKPDNKKPCKAVCGEFIGQGDLWLYRTTERRNGAIDGLTTTTKSLYLDSHKFSPPNSTLRTGIFF